MMRRLYTMTYNFSIKCGGFNTSVFLHTVLLHWVFEILCNIPFFFAQAGMDQATGPHISSSWIQGPISSPARDALSAAAVNHYGGRNNCTGFALLRTGKEALLCRAVLLISIAIAMGCASGPMALSSWKPLGSPTAAVLLAKLLFFLEPLKPWLGAAWLQCSCSAEGSSRRCGMSGENVPPGKIQDKPWSFARHRLGLCRVMSGR